MERRVDETRVRQDDRHGIKQELTFFGIPFATLSRDDRHGIKRELTFFGIPFATLSRDRGKSISELCKKVEVLCAFTYLQHQTVI